MGGGDRGGRRAFLDKIWTHSSPKGPKAYCQCFLQQLLALLVFLTQHIACSRPYSIRNQYVVFDELLDVKTDLAACHVAFEEFHEVAHFGRFVFQEIWCHKGKHLLEIPVALHGIISRVSRELVVTAAENIGLALGPTALFNQLPGEELLDCAPVKFRRFFPVPNFCQRQNLKHGQLPFVRQILLYGFDKQGKARIPHGSPQGQFDLEVIAIRVVRRLFAFGECIVEDFGSSGNLVESMGGRWVLPIRFE